VPRKKAHASSRGEKTLLTLRAGSRRSGEGDMFSLIALHGSRMVASRVQRNVAGRAVWGSPTRLSSPFPAGTLLRGISQQMRFHLYHPPMHLVFTVHTRRCRVRFASRFHIGEDLFARGKPHFTVHCFFCPLPSCNGMIFPAFLFPGYPSCKKVRRILHCSLDGLGESLRVY
jgi:hypothetical protein